MSLTLREAAARARRLYDLAPPLVGFALMGLAAVMLFGLARCDGGDAAGTRAGRAMTDAAAQIATTQVEKADAVGALAEESHERIGKIEARTRRAVARVREAAGPAPVLAAAPGDGAEPGRGGDAVGRAFYDGVCASAFYGADPVCHGRGERPEGGDSRRGP